MAEKIDFEPIDFEPEESKPKAKVKSDREVIENAMNGPSLKDVGSGALKALDYLGGLGRTAVGSLGNLTGKKVVTADDAIQALLGNAPGSAEMLERAGVPEGASANLFPELPIPFTDIRVGKGKTSMRDVGGLALDIATDPLTYLTFGTSGAAKAARPVSSLLEKAGEKTYKSGLKRIDQEVAKYGKSPVSDVLMKNRIAGSANSVYEQMDELGEQLLKERNEILSAAKEAGAEVSMKEAMIPVQERIASMRASRDPKLQKLADVLEKDVKEYVALDSKYQPAYTPIESITQGSQELMELPVQSKMNPSFQEVEITPRSKPDQFFSPISSGENLASVKPGKVIPESYTQRDPVVALIDQPSQVKYGPTVPESYSPGPDPVQASGYKTSIGLDMPDSAFRDAEILKQTQRASKDKYMGMKRAVETSVGNTLGEGAQQSLVQKNDELGRILTSKDKQFIEGQKEANKNIITSIDGLILGLNNPGAFAGKKAADLLKTTAVRTYGGRAMQDIGKGSVSGPIVDILSRKTVTGPKKKESKEDDGIDFEAIDFEPLNE